MTFILHNSEIIEDRAVLGIRDRALRGDGVFDTMLIKDGSPVFAKEHFERLCNHARVLNIPVQSTIENFKNDACRIIDKNGVNHGCLTTTISRGPATRGLQTPLSPDVQIIMRAAETPSMDGIAIHTIIAQTIRKNEGSPLSRIKSLNYGDHILAKMEAEKTGANEAILLNNKGHVCCFTIGNIVILKDGNLMTPPLSDGCMDGIIRAKLIAHHGVQERTFTSDDLTSADAIYLTNSLRGVAAVTSLNGKTMPPHDFSIDCLPQLS